MPPVKTNDEKYEDLKKDFISINDSIKEIYMFIKGNPLDQNSSLFAKFTKIEKSIEKMGESIDKMEESIDKHEKSLDKINKLEGLIDSANKKIDEITKQRDAVKWFMYGLFLTGTYGTFEFLKKIVQFFSDKL